MGQNSSIKRLPHGLPEKFRRHRLRPNQVDECPEWTDDPIPVSLFAFHGLYIGMVQAEYSRDVPVPPVASGYRNMKLRGLKIAQAEQRQCGFMRVGATPFTPAAACPNSPKRKLGILLKRIACQSIDAPPLPDPVSGAKVKDVVVVAEPGPFGLQSREISALRRRDPEKFFFRINFCHVV
jgi:hypothetical protein